MKTITTEYNYDHIFLKPKKCVVNSRVECSTNITLGKNTFSLPCIPANMKSVVNIDTCKFFANRNLFYIMHRFGINLIEFIKEMEKNNIYTSISIGVNDDSYKTLIDIIKKSLIPDYITIDVAHAHSPKCEKMVKFIKDAFPNTFLIVGNCVTKESIIDIQNWGANCIKVFIGPGHACTTRLETGFTRGTVDTLLECSEVSKVPIIADGGISQIGDINKALACGAYMVMMGSFFSGFLQSAGDIIEIEGKQYKEYYGSASEFNKTNLKHIEGKKILIPYKGDIDPFLDRITDSIKSGISYAGGKDLSAFLSCDLIYLR